MEYAPKPVRDFISYLTVVRNRTQQTADKYRHDLCMFLRYVAATRDGLTPGTEEYNSYDISEIDEAFIKTIATDDILSFLYHKKSDDHNESRAIARRLSAIKSFFKYYSVSRHLIDESPAVNIETPPHKKTLPRFLTLEQSIALLDAIRSDTESPTRERDYAIITLFLNSGMRLSELTGINLGNIDPELRSLRVLGKGAKERIIYLHEACREALEVYLPIRRADGEVKPGHSEALFLSRQHRRISNPTVQKMVYKYLDAAGLGSEHFSVHKLRHTAATLMYRSGAVDVRVLKDILGHEQLNTTQIYTHVSDTQMERAMDANPLAHRSTRKRRSDTDGE